jgi:hypothetical protein
MTAELQHCRGTVAAEVTRRNQAVLHTALQDAQALSGATIARVSVRECGVQRRPAPRPFLRTFFAIAILSLFALRPVLAQPDSLDLQLAREAAIVTTVAKREFSGLLDGLRDGRLFIRVATGGGEVGYSFAPDDIASLTLPGADFEARATELCDRGAFAEAFPLLEALARQRLRYLPVLADAHQRPLWQLVRASMRAGNPLTTLGYVNQLRILPSMNDANRILLRDAELDAHVKLGRVDDIQRLATAWCAEADLSGDSALGWKILAQVAYDRGDFAKARWTALQPVVFSGHLPIEHLDACYALAISAAHRLRGEPHAAVLYREMQTRTIAWPEIPALAAIGAHYAALPPDAVPQPAPVESSVTLRAPPENPPNRTLDQVRKIATRAAR